MQKEHIFVKLKDIPKSYTIIYSNLKKKKKIQNIYMQDLPLEEQRCLKVFFILFFYQT